MSRRSTIKTASTTSGSPASPRSLILANASGNGSISDRFSLSGSVDTRPFLKARHQEGPSPNHTETPSDTKPCPCKGANRRITASVTKHEISISRATTVALVEIQRAQIK